MLTIENKTKCLIQSRQVQLLADTVTPVNVYLSLRDQYPKAILLESSDYHGQDNSYSFICLSPIADFIVQGEQLHTRLPNSAVQTQSIDNLSEAVEQFVQQFQIEGEAKDSTFNGLFGYMGYDAVRYFEHINWRDSQPDAENAMPDMCYSFYRYVIAINHFKNSMTIIENLQDGQTSGLDALKKLIFSNRFATYPFQTQGEERSNMTDDYFIDMVKKGKQHCQRGDVFQMVLSRRFEQSFLGDEFNVYRALRSINPSPYLFYFDMGDFKIFGSSPEAQIVVKEGMATIHPIAGTFKRTGDDAADQQLAEELLADPKENAEHVMLVDLARNDLGRNCTNVQVETFKEVQFYSHVIHLVSKVTGRLQQPEQFIKTVGESFPAGTLSGAPKHRAMQLINDYEPTPRAYYGGAIGHIGFDGSYNHAIMIRSFLSKQNTLFYQAGAGVVNRSVPESELQEVNNKLAALKKAVTLAESIVA